MGLLAQRQLPELDSVFHTAVYSKVLVHPDEVLALSKKSLSRLNLVTRTV